VAVEWLSQLPYESIAVVCHMNVVAHISSILLAESFHSFALAEARIYAQPVIVAGLSTTVKSFIPSLKIPITTVVHNRCCIYGCLRPMGFGHGQLGNSGILRKH